MRKILIFLAALALLGSALAQEYGILSTFRVGELHSETLPLQWHIMFEQAAGNVGHTIDGPLALDRFDLIYEEITGTAPVGRLNEVCFLNALSELGWELINVSDHRAEDLSQRWYFKRLGP